MAQNLSPIILGKPIITAYPTPNISDRIFRVRKDSRLADYAVPEPGTPFDGKREFEDKLDGFVFATATPVADPSQAELVDWWYLDERANQDAYNFTVEYPYSDPDCPRLTRTYVYLRGSEPPPISSDVDPIFTELVLVDQKQTRLQDPILDSLFTATERIYECLPSPAVTTVADRPESVLPFNMRVALPTTEESHAEQGAAGPPSMTDDDWHKQEQQQTLFRKLVTSVKRILPGGGITLNMGRRLTRDQQVGTVTQTWKAGGQSITPSATLIEATVDDVGNNTTVKEEVTVPSVFPQGIYEKEIPDIIPPEFRVAVPVVSSEETSAGTASTNPTLASGDLRVRESQITTQIKRVLRATRAAITLPVTLINILTSRDKQVVTQTRTLQDSGTSTALPTATQDVKVTQLGNDTELEEIESVPEVFDAISKEVGTSEVIPLRFRAASGISTISDREAGTVPGGDLSLGTGEVLRREEQENKFVKKVTVTKKSEVITPTLYGQNYDEVNDIPIGYEERLEDSGTSLGQNRTEVTPLSDQLDLARTISPAGEWFFDTYLLQFESKINVPLPNILTGISSFVEIQSQSGDSSRGAATGAISNAGSYTSSPSSRSSAAVAAIPDVTPYIREPDGANRRATHYIFLLKQPSTIDDVLAKLQAILSTPTGSSATVTISLANPTVVTWSTHGLSNGDLVFFTTTGTLPFPIVANQYYYVRNTTTNTFQLSTSPSGILISTAGSTQSGVQTGQQKSPASLTDWPKFTRENVTIFCVGARGSVSAEAESYFHYGYNNCSSCATSESTAYHGNGASRDISIVIKAVRIPATIHGDISVSGFHSSSYSATATASATGMGTTDSRSASVVVNAYVSPTFIYATPDGIEIPTEGLFLFDTDVAPYKYGRIRYHVTVLNGADL